MLPGAQALVGVPGLLERGSWLCFLAGPSDQESVCFQPDSEGVAESLAAQRAELVPSPKLDP